MNKITWPNKSIILASAGLLVLVLLLMQGLNRVYNYYNKALIKRSNIQKPQKALDKDSHVFYSLEVCPFCQRTYMLKNKNIKKHQGKSLFEQLDFYKAKSVIQMGISILFGQYYVAIKGMEQLKIGANVKPLHACLHMPKEKMMSLSWDEMEDLLNFKRDKYLTHEQRVGQWIMRGVLAGSSLISWALVLSILTPASWLLINKILLHVLGLHVFGMIGCALWVVMNVLQIKQAMIDQVVEHLEQIKLSTRERFDALMYNYKEQNAKEDNKMIFETFKNYLPYEKPLHACMVIYLKNEVNLFKTQKVEANGYLLLTNQRLILLEPLTNNGPQLISRLVINHSDVKAISFKQTMLQIEKKNLGAREAFLIPSFYQSYFVEKVYRHILMNGFGSQSKEKSPLNPVMSK